MAYLMYVSAALTHLWAIYAPQNQYWIMKGCRNAAAPFFYSVFMLLGIRQPYFLHSIV